MKAYYAEVKYDDYIGLTALEVREGAKVYMVESKRAIVGGGCYDRRIPKDSPYFHLTLEKAIAYIQQRVMDSCESKQKEITKLQDGLKKLLDAYELSKAKGEANTTARTEANP